MDHFLIENLIRLLLLCSCFFFVDIIIYINCYIGIHILYFEGINGSVSSSISVMPARRPLNHLVNLERLLDRLTNEPNCPKYPTPSFDPLERMRVS